MADQLFSEFPQISTEDWIRQIESELKGKSPDTLNWKLRDGTAMKPFYRAENAQALSTGIPLRNADQPWKIHHDFQFSTRKELADALLADAQHTFRLDSAGIVLGGNFRGYECSPWPFFHWSPGFRDDSVQELTETLSLLQMQNCEVHLTAASALIPGFISLIRAYQNKGIALKDARGSIDNDPYRFLMKCGTLLFGDDNTFAMMASVLHFARKEMPAFRPVTISTEPVHLAGGYGVHELAFALAIAADYAEQMEKHGLPPVEVLPHIQFVLSSGTDFFPEIAKFRAFRRLWDTFTQAYGFVSGACPAHLRGKGSAWSQSLIDPHVNILRATTQAMSAVTGGCDAVVLPEYDQPGNPATGFSARIARNVQVLLREEARLGKVADPAAGSWYVEQLTADIERAAWKLFVRIEEEGGFLKAFRKGFIHQVLNPAAEKWMTDMATGKEKLIGVNQYPAQPDPEGMQNQVPLSFGASEWTGIPENLAKALSAPVQERVQAVADALPDTFSFTDLVCEMLDIRRTIVPMLQNTRLANDVEQLRRLTETAIMNTGHRPLVFLLTYGDPKMRAARSAFSQNLFLTAGFSIAENPSPEDAAATMSEISRLKPDFIVLCSSDAENVAAGEGWLLQLKRSGAKVILAGKPEGSETWTEKGLHSRIFAGMNMLEYLFEMVNEWREA